MKKTIEFEQDNFSIEVDGVEYDIPKRTQATETKIQDFIKTKDTRNDIDNYKMFFEILFGREKAKQLTAKGKDENLDKLDKILSVCFDLYYYDKNRALEEKMEKDFEQIKPILDTIEKTKNIPASVIKNV